MVTFSENTSAGIKIEIDTPTIVSVQLLENRRLLVKFANGVEKIYDCQPLIERYEPFKALENEVFFKHVKAHSGGYGILWNDNVDLSEYELWTNAVEVIRA